MQKSTLVCSWTLAMTITLFATSAVATEPKTPPLAEIRAQQLQIRSQLMASSAPYDEMSKDTRDALVAKQSELLDLIGDKQSLDELDETDKTAAFNALESIKAAINEAEDNRIVCERRRPVGSNRVQRVCATVAERRIEREDAVKTLEWRPLCNNANNMAC